MQELMSQGNERFIIGPPTHSVGARLVILASVCRRPRLSSAVSLVYRRL